jgi:hypothetical protein
MCIYEYSSTAIPHALFMSTGQPMVARLSPLDEAYEKEKQRREQEEKDRLAADDLAVRVALLAAII